MNNMRGGRQENYIPNTEQDENRPNVGYILLTNDIYLFIYILYIYTYAIHPFIEGRPKGSRRVNSHGEIIRSGVEQFSEVPL